MSALRRRTRLAAAVAAVALAIPLLAACGGSGSGDGIEVADAWARPSPMVAGAGAAYMTITNSGSEADALLGAASDVATTVEVHETVAMEAPAATDGMGGMETPAATDGTGGEMMGMRPVERVEIPAGGTVNLEPGGYHVMLIGLKEPLEVGSTIEITLTFEKAGERTVKAEVREG
jgi:copper(I)-binding protein